MDLFLDSLLDWQYSISMVHPHDPHPGGAPMTKKFYAIKQGHYIFPGTWYLRRDAIQNLIDRSGRSWKSMQEIGYSVIKVEVRELSTTTPEAHR